MPTTPDPSSRSLVARGTAVYAKRCASCHDVNLEIVKHGIPEIVPAYQTDMPKYDEILSDGDIWALLSFIESAWPAMIRERQRRLNERSH